MSEESDFTDEPYRGTQILWGRVVVLLLALALAFWLGTTFGGDASAQDRLEEQRAEIAKLESEVAALEAEVAAVDAGDQAGDQNDGSSQDGGNQNDGGGGIEAPNPRAPQPSQDEPDEDATADGDGETGTTPTNADEDAGQYVVQSGDSLAAIAQEVYGDPTLWRDIARANDLEEPYSLTVGDTLAIPAKP
jgi:nucleoid-associated protein YgaU